MTASERFDAALRDFRQSLDLLEEPGHLTCTVSQRPSLERHLYLVKVTQRWVPTAGPAYGPTYFVNALELH